MLERDFDVTKILEVDTTFHNQRASCVSFSLIRQNGVYFVGRIAFTRSTAFGDPVFMVVTAEYQIDSMQCSKVILLCVRGKCKQVVGKFDVLNKC